MSKVFALFDESAFYSVEAHGDVVFRDAGYFGNLVVGALVEPEGDNSLVDGVEVGDEGVEHLEFLELFGAYGGVCAGVGEAECFGGVDCGVGVAVVAAVPGDACVEGHAVNPGAGTRLASERVEADPEVYECFLIQVFKRGSRARVEVADLGDDGAVSADHRLVSLCSVSGSLFHTI